MTRSKASTPTFDVRELFDYHEDGYLIWRRNQGYNKTKGRRAGVLEYHGYSRVRVYKKSYAEHRLIWMWHYGTVPSMDLDHIDRNRSNNRIENLRLASRARNNQNSTKRKNTSSRWKGVSWAKHVRKWHAYLNTENGRLQLGYFDKEVDAAAAYDRAAEEHFGDYAVLNLKERYDVAQ